MDAASNHNKQSPYEVLKIPEFRRFITARVLISLAMQIQGVAVAWQVYSLTKDPLSLGLIGLAEVIPAIGCALFAGHIVDRNDRRKILVLTFAVSVGVCLALLLLTLAEGRFGAARNVHLIYGAVFVSGIARAFYSPSSFAFLSEIIPRRQYVRSAAWNSTSWQLSSAAGPAIAGLIYGFVGAAATYATTLVFLLLGIASVLRIKARGKPSIHKKETFGESLTAGIRFVFSRPVILSALSLDLFAVLFGGAVALLPIFADLLKVGPQGLGLMRAAPSAGAFLMAFYLAHRPPTVKAGKILLSAVAGFGVCMVLFALSKSFTFTLLVLAVSGAFDNVSVVVRQTILQLLTPDEMRGRVSAVNNIFIGSSNEIGDFESGLTAKWMGTVPAVVLGGCITVLVVLTTAWISPQIRKLNLNEVGAAGGQEPA